MATQQNDSKKSGREHKPLLLTNAIRPDHMYNLHFNIYFENVCLKNGFYRDMLSHESQFEARNETKYRDKAINIFIWKDGWRAR